MKTTMQAILGLAICAVSGSSIAQTVGPAGAVPSQAVGYGALGGTYVPVTPAAPLPVFSSARTAGTANRVITKISVAANTSTTVCPMATSPISTEIQVGAGGVGLGLNGQALTTATIGTLTTDPDLVVAAAGTLYTLPVAATNAITAFTATPQIIVCIQNVQ